MKLGIIPARAGSKRIPHKNIKEFCGKPIIAWTIEAALNSGCFDRVIVSTDSSEIAQVARFWGAETPFLRPTQLADDYTGTIPVIRHAINFFNENGDAPDQVCCLYATAPFIQPEDLGYSLEILLKSSAHFVFSATSYAFPIQRALRLTSEGRAEMFQPEHFATRSQNLEQAYHDAGQFYWGHTKAWLEQDTVFTRESLLQILPRHRVQDIDTLEDWERAEWLFRSMQESR